MASPFRFLPATVLFILGLLVANFVFSDRNPASRTSPIVRDEHRPTVGPPRHAPVAPVEPAASRHTTRDELLEPAIAFDAWLQGHRPDDPVSLAEGVRLAQARRTALKELIAFEPEAALRSAVPRATRASLPSEILAELEIPVDDFGSLIVTVSCSGSEATIERVAEIQGRRYAAHTFGRRLATVTKYRLPLHGIAIDDRFALAEDPYRAIEPGELPAMTSPGLSVAIGNETRQFESAAMLEVWRDEIATAEAAIDPWAELTAHRVSAVTADWTLGDKRLLWILVDFPDEPGAPIATADLVAAGENVDRFFQDNSRGRCSMRSTILPAVLRVSQNKESYTTDSLRAEATALARAYDAANGNDGTYNPDRYDRWMVYSKRVLAFGNLVGIAEVGGKGALLNGVVNHAANTGCHELGHNHGLRHSHAWGAELNPPILLPASHDEYGDVFDVMGRGGVGDNAFLGAHFNTKQKELLSFLEPAEISAATTSGVYRIYRHDERAATGVQALTVATRNYDYWLEYRLQSPSHEAFPFLDRLPRGVQIRWGRTPRYTVASGTYLIDSSPSSEGGISDATLVIGETFLDAQTGIQITPLATGGEAPHEWIDVRVDLGASGSNRNPLLSVAAIPAVLPARAEIPFSASAVDPDGNPVSFLWQFADDVLPVHGQTATYRFAGAGDHTVRCSVSDGLGGIASQEFAVSVVDPLGNWDSYVIENHTAASGAVLHDGTQFVAIGGYVATSGDGVTWKRGSYVGGSCADLVYDGSRYIGAGTRTTGTFPNFVPVGAIHTSTDLESWQQATLPSDSGPLQDLAMGGGRFVAVGSGGAIFQSDDGSTWSAIDAGVTDDIAGVEYADGKFVAVAPNGLVLVSSDGGKTWKHHTLPVRDNLYGIVHHRGEWIAQAARMVYKSTDAENWTSHLTNALLGGNAFASLNAAGVLVNANRENELQVSADGVNWKLYAFTPAGSEPSILTGVCEYNGVIVGVGSWGLFLRSSLQLPATSAPAISSQPQGRTPTIGAAATLSVASASDGVSYRWTRNGAGIPGATQLELILPAVQPAETGLYFAIVTEPVGGSASISLPAIVGVSSSEKLVGSGTEYPNIVHSETQRVYDQLLLGGAAASFTADSAENQVTRLSYIDLTDDIVQIEYSGPGTVSIVLDGSSGPAAPANYNQSTLYMKGHAGIVVTGATEQSNLTIFSVGRGTAVNQTLFSDSIAYDGLADVAFVAIQSSNGKFGGLRASNANFWSTRGYTGVYAPGVEFNGPVFVHDINAQQDATPVLMIGSALGETRITGGDLLQANSRAVRVSGLTQLRFTDGVTSHYRTTAPDASQYLLAKQNRARLERDGVDVTIELVANP